MLKITKMLAVLLAVSAFAVSATPAMGDGKWTGLGDGVNWSDMLNWKKADGVTWELADPTAGGQIYVETAGTSKVDIDMNDPTKWATLPSDLRLGGAHTLVVQSGGTLSHDNYFHLNGTFRLDGGDYRGNSGWKSARAYGTIEFLGGTWNTGSTPAYYAGIWYPGNVHVIGLTAGYDFSPLSFRDMTPANASFQFTLEAGEGVATITPGSVGAVNTDTIPLTVDGIKAYLGAGGSVGDTFDLIRCATEQDAMLQFQTGDVLEGGDLVGKVTATKTAVTLEVLPEPATMILLAGGLPLLLRRRRRRR